MLTRDTFIGPWAGLPVSWTEDDRFDAGTYRDDVARCCQADVPGVYTGGTTGEFYAMEFDEFKDVTRVTVEECKRHGVPCMIGCTSTYTLGAVRRAAFAAECGADAIQAALPFWMEVPESEIVTFFREVARAAPTLPLSIYETRRAKVALTLEQHRAIKEAVPRYMMVKANVNTLGNSSEGCQELSGFVNVFVGESEFGRLGRCGAVGSCSSMVYWAPAFILDIWRQMQAENWEAVDRDCARIEKLLDFLVSHWDGRGLTDSADDRLGARASGFLKVSLRCRGPYPHANEHDITLWRNWCREHFSELIAHLDGESS